MDALLILIKNPITNADRLPVLRVFTDKQMLELKTAFVEDIICSSTPLKEVDIKVAVAPKDRARMVARAVTNLQERYAGRQAFAVLPERLEVLTQKVIQLGERARDAVGHCFAGGYERVLMVGGYNPTITRQHLAGAMRELKNHAVVLGPTIRGGLYLVGMSAHFPELFAEVPLGTDRAYAAICERLQELDIEWRELDLWYDISHQEDIEFIIRDINHFRLTGDEDAARATEEILAKYVEKDKESSQK